MGTWNSRGLRGSTLEDLINHTNDLYREKKLALIQKIPTPHHPHWNWQVQPPHHPGLFWPEEYRGLYRGRTGDSGVFWCQGMRGKDISPSKYPSPPDWIYGGIWETGRNCIYHPLFYRPGWNILSAFWTDRGILETDGGGRAQKLYLRRGGQELAGPFPCRFSGPLSGRNTKRPGQKVIGGFAWSAVPSMLPVQVLS